PDFCLHRAQPITFKHAQLRAGTHSRPRSPYRRIRGPMPGTTLAAPQPDLKAATRRLFLGWDRAALRTTAALLAEHYATPDELRMDAATVVLPGARATRRLKEHLLEEAELRGLRLVPPHVTTVGTLPELLYTPPRPQASDAL